MTSDCLGIGGAGFLAYLAAILVLLRLVDRMSPALVVTGTALVVYLGMLAVAAGLERPVLFWRMSAAYWFLTGSFLMMFGAIYKSISLRILLDLLDQPSWSDRHQAILDRYVERESYEERLRILAKDGLATRSPAGFQLTPKGRRLAAAVKRCQDLFRIAQSG